MSLVPVSVLNPQSFLLGFLFVQAGLCRRGDNRPGAARRGLTIPGPAPYGAALFSGSGAIRRGPTGFPGLSLCLHMTPRLAPG